MSSACTLILVGMASSVSEIKLGFKFGQISLLDHGHAPTQLSLPLEIINFALLLN